MAVRRSRCEVVGLSWPYQVCRIFRPRDVRTFQSGKVSRYCNSHYCGTNHNQDWTRRCRTTWLLHKPDSFGHDRYRTCSYQLLIWARMRYRTTHNGGQPSIGRRMSSVRSTCQMSNPGAHRACIDLPICLFCSAPHWFPNTGKNNHMRSGSRHCRW